MVPAVPYHITPWGNFLQTFGFTNDSKGPVIEDTQRETDKNRRQSGNAFEVCNLSDGREKQLVWQYSGFEGGGYCVFISATKSLSIFTTLIIFYLIHSG